MVDVRLSEQRPDDLRAALGAHNGELKNRKSMELRPEITFL